MATADPNSDEISCKPLDTLELRINNKNGMPSTVLALHIGFMETRSYVQFSAPPTTDDTGQDTLDAAEEEWLECASFLEEDLHWVLKLPHNRFWSQVVYDESLHKCLESYLSHSPRGYDFVNLKLKDEIQDALKKIHKLVFKVYLRMSTHKESKKDHITPEGFAEIIYDNFLFDVPKIMDLCVLYGIQNIALVSKMVQNIFSKQTKYFEDLHRTSLVVLETFGTIEEKISTNLHEFQNSSTRHQLNGVNTKKHFTLSSFHDIVNYITDVSATLHAFLEVYSNACLTFYQNEAAKRIPTFYDHIFPTIEREVVRRSKPGGCERIIEDIERKIVLSKTLLIKTFRGILNYCCIQNVLDSKLSESGRNSSESAHIEQFLEIFTEIANEKNFLQDYNKLYPFETDLELFAEMGLNLDPQRLSYIFCSIHDTGDAMPENFASSSINGARPKTKKRDVSQAPVQSLQGAADLLRGNGSSGKTDSRSTPNVSDPYGAEKSCLDENELNSLISSVQDILENCNGGFIERCLQHYNYNADAVIDAYVTGSLPDHLNQLDRSLGKEIEPKVGTSGNYSILHERKGIFDNDEFDMFRRTDIDMDKVHIGKKNKTPTAYQALQSEPESDFLKKLTLTYGAEETEYNDEMNLYEDEYDDTYDSAMVGLKEPAPEGEPDNESPEDKKKEKSPDKSSEMQRDTSRDFCENPEVIRERAQQRRDAKIASRGNRRGGPPPENDNSRQHKDRHKANVGNHNRRQQSDFKRRRGMLPI